MKSLWSHQPNTDSPGFYNWTPSSTDGDGQERLANGAITQGGSFQKTDIERWDALHDAKQLTLPRTRTQTQIP